MSANSSSTIEQLLTVVDVAKLFNVHPSSVRRLQQQRRLRFYKVGGSVRIDKKDVVSYLEKSRVESIG